MEKFEILDVPTWATAAVNAERRKLRETPRLWHLSGMVEAKIAAIQANPGRERGRSGVFRLPRHPPVRSSAVYGSGEGRLVLWLQAGDEVLIVAIVATDYARTDACSVRHPSPHRCSAPVLRWPRARRDEGSIPAVGAAYRRWKGGLSQ